MENRKNNNCGFCYGCDGFIDDAFWYLYLPMVPGWGWFLELVSDYPDDREHGENIVRFWFGDFRFVPHCRGVREMYEPGSLQRCSPYNGTLAASVSHSRMADGIGGATKSCSIAPSLRGLHIYFMFEFIPNPRDAPVLVWLSCLFFMQRMFFR